MLGFAEPQCIASLPSLLLRLLLLEVDKGRLSNAQLFMATFQPGSGAGGSVELRITFPQTWLSPQTDVALEQDLI